MRKLRRGFRVLRTMLRLRRARVTYGRRPTFTGRMPRVEGRGNMHVGDNFEIRCLPRERSYVGAGPSGRLVIGNRVFINEGVHIYADRHITIGDNVRIAPRVAIYDTNFHEVSPGDGVIRCPVKIGDNVWIGQGAIILPGVVIGAHAVVAAGSVVTRSVPARTVVAGNPAREVKTFDCPPDYIRGP